MRMEVTLIKKNSLAVSHKNSNKIIEMND